MGRRQQQELRASTNGDIVKQSPQELQIKSESEKAVLSLLERLRSEIEAKLKDPKAMSEMDLDSLTKTLCRILNAVKKPATSLMQVVVPNTPQHPEYDRRGEAIDASVVKPEDAAVMRERAESFLDAHAEE